MLLSRTKGLCVLKGQSTNAQRGCSLLKLSASPCHILFQRYFSEDSQNSQMPVGAFSRAAVYGQLIRSHCQKKQWAPAVQRWREMNAEGLLLKPSYVNQLVFTCNKAQQLEAAKEVATGWLEAGGESSSWYFISAAIKACNADNDWKTAMELLNLTEKPNIHCYTAALKVLGSAGQWEMMDSLLERMRRENEHPTEATHTVLINAWAQGLQKEKMLDYVERITCKGLKPDKILYATVIKALCMTGDWDVATSLEKEAKLKGLSLDREVYISAMACLAESGNVRACEGMLKEIKRQAELGDGPKPCKTMYGAMLQACAVSGDWEKAVAYLREGHDSGLRLSVVLYAKAMRACMKARQEEEAMRLLQSMVTREITPNPYVWNTLATIEHCPDTGSKSKDFTVAHLNRVLKWVRQMKQIPPGYLHVVRLRSLFGEQGRWRKEALDYLQEAIEDKLPPRDLVKLYNMTMNIFAEAGERGKILELMSEMRTNSLQPDKFSFNALVKCFEPDGSWEEGVEVLQEMRALGIDVDQRICHSVLNACAEAQNLDAALSIFREMEYHGFKADKYTYGILFKACVKVQKPEEAFSLYIKMRKEHIQVPKGVLNSLITFFLDTDYKQYSNQVFFDKLKQKEVVSPNI